MCDGIALNLEDLPQVLIERFGLRKRIVQRTPESVPEVHFLHRVKPRQLPAWFRNGLEILPWGNNEGRIPELPWTSWIEMESLAEGRWRVPYEQVVIPASLGFDRRIWYQIREGIVGIVVSRGTERVLFMLTEESTHYYRTMTRSERMPVFVGAETY